jgi:4-hydroxybenzoate polyprenyltransferase
MPVSNPSPSSSRLLAYLQLMRLPNVFTAMADVAMGYFVTHAALSQRWELLCLLVSSSALYTAGMVLNDVLDREQDRRERPERPIPSGRVALSTAVCLGIGLAVLGVAASALVGIFAQRWGPLSVSLGLVVFIVAYDGKFKHTAGGPLAMGICRMLNVLLGMSASAMPPSTANSVIACGIGLYVAGVTWFAMHEATVSRRTHLIGGLVMVLGGMALLFSFPWWMPAELSENFSVPNWIVLSCVVAALVDWRFVWAILRPEPALVQQAVKHGILSIIVLDAMVVFAVRGTVPASCVLLLLAPAIALGRRVYST